MRKSRHTAKLVTAAAMAVALALSLSAPVQAQIPALLPLIDDVRPGAPLPIDGTWRIREIDELVVFRGGYAYAVDGWTHALVFRIMPRQIIMTNLRATSDGGFIGDNLPLMAKFTLTPLPDGSLLGRTQAMIPATYTFESASVPIDSPWDGTPQPSPDESAKPPDDWVSPW